MGTYFLKRFSLSSQRESYSFHGFLTAENFSRIVDIYFRSKSRCWRGGDGHCSSRPVDRTAFELHPPAKIVVQSPMLL